MTTTWLVRCGDGGRHIDDAVSRGIITVDFSAASDVTGLPVEEIATQLEGTKTRTAINRLAEMLFAFANELEKGDVIISSDRARRQVVVGRVAGPYEYVEAEVIPDQHHTRLVDWKARWGWDDLPDPVKNTVLHYQRTVLKFPDQESALALAEEAEASGMAAVYAPPVRRTRGSAIDPRLEGASRSERLCTSCFIIRPLSEFEGESAMCRVCE
jgi:predicted Mrr-cat superfamily restriction endonuclease